MILHIERDPKTEIQPRQRFMAYGLTTTKPTLAIKAGKTILKLLVFLKF